MNSIDLQKCAKCELCMEVCPCNCLAINQNGAYFIDERLSICLHCGQCMAICQSKAIQVDGFTYENNFWELPLNPVSFEQLEPFLALRRSVRNFANKPVSNELIEKVLSVLHYVPFGASPQKVHISVVNNRPLIEESLPLISEFLDNIVKWVEHPVISRIIRFKKGEETFNTIKNHLYPISNLGNYKLEFGDRITRGAPVIVIFHAHTGAEEHTHNAIINATYVTLAAHSLGLGATIIGLVPAAINKVEKVREMYQIPKNHEAVISVILGYPKYKYKRTIKRELQPIHWIE